MPASVNLKLTLQLANERTFLAWLKTSLVFVSVGIGLAQLSQSTKHHSQLSLLGLTIKVPLEDDHSKLRFGLSFAAVSIILGMIILFIGAFRFYQTQSFLLEQRYPVAKHSAFLLGIAAIVMCILLLLMASSL